MKNIYEFISEEENTFHTSGVPVVDGYEWKFYEHVRLSILYKNSKFSTGADDGNRPYKNIIRPILNVAYRSEGFDVKDIEPFVDDKDNYYKSFLVRKFHDKWARKNDLDTFIDEVVESYVDFGGALVKNVNGIKPEVVPLQRIAFCDQTDILSGPICEKHSFSPDQLLEFAGKWDEEAINDAISLANQEKQSVDNKQRTAKTPGKYIEVYELNGVFPETWLNENGNPDKYSRQLHIVTFTKKDNNNKEGITLFKGKEKEGRYKLILRDKIYGRALGFGGIEELFEPQVWTNYNQIQIKKMLDAASDIIIQTDDQSFTNRNKIADREPGEIVVVQKGSTLSQVNVQPVNIGQFDKYMQDWELQARTTGSANDPQLGVEPASGTPMGLQSIVVNQGQGIHEYRRGKIATFFGEIYRDWILKSLVREMNQGNKWLEELDLDEMQFVAKQISTKASNKKAVDMVIKYFDKEGKAPTQEEIDAFTEVIKNNFIESGNKHFIEIVSGELNKIPIDVYVNVAGKQKNLSKVATGLTNIFRQVFANPTILQNPGMAKLFNEIVEASGFSPVSFQGLDKLSPQPQGQQLSPQNNQNIINQ